MKERPAAEREGTWRPSRTLTLVVAGSVLGVLELMRRARKKKKARSVDVGFVSDEWLAEHRADRS